MKLLMILGGMIGFAIGLGFGYARQSSGASILWRSCIAAAAAGLLMRWWGQVWMRCLQESHQQRLAAAEKKADS